MFYTSPFIQHFKKKSSKFCKKSCPNNFSSATFNLVCNFQLGKQTACAKKNRVSENLQHNRLFFLWWLGGLPLSHRSLGGWLLATTHQLPATRVSTTRWLAAMKTAGGYRPANVLRFLFFRGPTAVLDKTYLKTAGVG